MPPTDRDALALEAVDVMARALCAIHFDWPFETKTPGTQEMLRSHAAIILAALEEAGMVVVPAVPTEKMISAGLRAPVSSVDPHSLARSEMYCRYRAMLSAHSGAGTTGAGE